MDPVAACYGVVASLAFYFAAGVAAFEGRRLVAPAACAAVLLVTWGLSTVLWMCAGRGAVLVANPIMDLACGTAAALLYRREPATWKAALTLCFMTQSLLHGWYWTVGMAPYAYHLLLNLLFLGSLACVCLPGGGYVASGVSRWMRRRAVRRGVAMSRESEAGAD